MKISHIYEKAFTSPPVSNVSNPNYYEFALSQQLQSPYRPNFKKLSAKRRLHHHEGSINFRQFFNPKRFEQLLVGSGNSRTPTCILCEMTYSNDQMFELCKCDHKYCENCLIEYVSYKINAMEEIRCPEESCTERISTQGQIYTKLPQQLKKKYRRAQLWRQTIANPDLKLCPKESCEGQVDMKIAPPQCTTCKKFFCQECMMQKHEGNCDIIYEKIHKEWRRCPKCRMFITKQQGCNHIRCRCSNQFCFVCLQKWNGSHYRCMQKEQMFYFNIDGVKHPMWVIALMVTIFPFLMIGGILAVVGTFAIMIPVGAIMGIGYALLKYFYLLCLVIILLPFAAVIGAVMLPFMFTFEKSIPESIHHFRRYKITLEQLFVKISQNSSS